MVGITLVIKVGIITQIREVIIAQMMVQIGHHIIALTIIMLTPQIIALIGHLTGMVNINTTKVINF